MVLLAEYRKLQCKNILQDYYSISERGEVLNLCRNRVVTYHPDKDGYLHLMLCTNDKLDNGNHKRVDFRVASLVAYTFIGEPPSSLVDPTIDHIDGNITNNHYTNLRWIERSENSSIRKNKGVGSQNHEAILNEKDVREIKELLKQGVLSLRQIGNRFGVSRYTISNIKRGVSWKHVT